MIHETFSQDNRGIEVSLYFSKPASMVGQAYNGCHIFLMDSWSLIKGDLFFLSTSFASVSCHELAFGKKGRRHLVVFTCCTPENREKNVTLIILINSNYKLTVLWKLPFICAHLIKQMFDLACFVLSKKKNLCSLFFFFLFFHCYNMLLQTSDILSWDWSRWNINRKS